ncbi:MAG TPA: Pycsar system effector family protein [Sphingobium sp.]
MSNNDKVEHFHTEFADFQEGYVRHYIALADTKAAVTFGVCSSLLAFVASDTRLGGILDQRLCSISGLLLIVAFFCLVVGASLSAWVVLPRLPNVGEGLVFFGAVKSYQDGRAYMNTIKSQDETALTSARLQHCYNTSKVCWQKYFFLRIAMWAAAFSVALLIVVLTKERF